MILTYYKAGFPALWVETAEPERTTQKLEDSLKKHPDVLCARWNVINGVSKEARPRAREDGADPLEAIQWLGGRNDPCVLVCSLLHRFVGSPEVQQSILIWAQKWKANGQMLVALVPPGTKPPVELARVFHTIEEALPDATELLAVARQVQTGNEKMSIKDPEAVAEALRGLTSQEAENIISLAAVRGGGRVEASEVWAETAQTIRASSGGTLELVRPQGGFSTLGGLEQIKAFCGRAVRSPKARGVILLGVPGTGKTVFAHALGAEAGLPVYLWDLGRLFGSLVGESEANARRTIQAIEAAGRCVLLVDEIEKGASGMGGSGSTDSGVTARTMGTVLTWLSDRAAGGAYVIATCNDVSKLPPEMTRAERWDATFFVDLPTLEERESIYAIHSKSFGVTRPFDQDVRRLTEDWTGAEIKSLCRLANMLEVDVLESSRYIVPLSRSRGEEIKALRNWAAGRCIPASEPTEGAETGRRITIDEIANSTRPIGSTRPRR